MKLASAPGASAIMMTAIRVSLLVSLTRSGSCRYRSGQILLMSKSRTSSGTVNAWSQVVPWT